MTQSLKTPLVLWLALLLWGGAFAYSFWVFQVTVPSGDGFTRGMNRVSGFIGWQVLASAQALVVFAIGRGLPKGAVMRRMSLLPLVLALSLVCAVVSVILWAVLTHP